MFGTAVTAAAWGAAREAAELLSNPQAAHVAFRVPTRAALAGFYHRAAASGVPTPLAPQDFGHAGSVFVTRPLLAPLVASSASAYVVLGTTGRPVRSVLREHRPHGPPRSSGLTSAH
jgi:hypothetical protein